MSTNTDPPAPTPPKPLVLEDLQLYISRQTEVIEQLYSSDGFHDLRPGNNWEILWKSIWGKGTDSLDTTQKVERGYNCDIIDKALLPDVAPIQCEIMKKPVALNACWGFSCERFLIRSEYKTAEDFLLSTSIKGFPRAAIVTGRPGIGWFSTCRPQPARTLTKFLRQIRLSPSHLLAPPCAQTSHRAAARAQSSIAFLRKRCEGIFASRDRGALRKSASGRYPGQQDLGSG